MKKIIIALAIFLVGVTGVAAKAGDFTNTDAEVFTFQKQVVADLKKILPMLTPEKSLRQKGQLQFKYVFNLPTFTGSATVRFDDIVSLYDSMSRNGSFAGKTTFAVDVTVMSPFDSGDVTRFKFDGNTTYVLTVSKSGDLYARLDTFEIRSSGTDALANASIESIKKMITPFLGKTYKIPGDTLDNGNQALLLNANVILKTLESYPLFQAITKQKDGTYVLRVIPSTMKKLGAKGWKASNKEVFIYTPNTLTTGAKFTFSEKKNKKNALTLESTLSGTRLQFQWNDKKTREIVHFTIDSGVIDFQTKSKGSQMNLTWKGNVFSFTVDSQAGPIDNAPIHFSIQGKLSRDLKNFSLDAFLDSKKLGSFNRVSVNGNSNFTGNFTFDNENMNFLFDMNGFITEEFGDFRVPLPAQFEIFDK